MCRQILAKLPNIIFNENPLPGLELFCVYGKMDGAILIGALLD
jgi:hypothetical protein